MSTFTTKRGYVSGLELQLNATTPASKIDVGPGACSDDAARYPLELAATLTADITASGANGLDTGSEAASTWYYVFVIGDSSGVNPPASLLSASPTSPTLPTGYDLKRRVGSVRNDLSSDLVAFVQKGSGCDRRYYYDASFASREVLSNGNATSFTVVDCSPLVPATSTLGYFQLGFETGASGQAADVLRVKPADITNALLRIRAGVVSSEKISVPAICPLDASQQLKYNVTRAANRATILVTGFEEDL